MNIYVETNFVLEAALLQEQHASCEDILLFCEGGRAQLIVPAYSLVEPYETLIRRHKQRKEIKNDLDLELSQLARTTTYGQRLYGFQSLTALLIDSVKEETRRLEETRSRIIKASKILQLNAAILGSATRYQKKHGLSPQDALVYATVLSHLEQSDDAQSCFLNKNSRDFDDPDLIAELNAHNCKLLPRFDGGYQFILSQSP